MTNALLSINVTIADISFANGAESLHLLGVALLRQMVALSVKACFEDLTQKYLVMKMILRTDLRPTMIILLVLTNRHPIMIISPRTNHPIRHQATAVLPAVLQAVIGAAELSRSS